MKHWLALALLVVHMGACQSQGPARTQAALLRAVDAPLHAEIHTVMREWLGAHVGVVDVRELMRVPYLALERPPFRDANGVRLARSEVEMPQVLRLELQNGQCQIVHAQTGQRRTLLHAQCLPVD